MGIAKKMNQEDSSVVVYTSQLAIAYSWGNLVRYSCRATTIARSKPSVTSEELKLARPPIGAQHACSDKKHRKMDACLIFRLQEMATYEVPKKYQDWEPMTTPVMRTPKVVFQIRNAEMRPFGRARALVA